jgi:hypothetical protein
MGQNDGFSLFPRVCERLECESVCIGVKVFKEFKRFLSVGDGGLGNVFGICHPSPLGNTNLFLRGASTSAEVGTPRLAKRSIRSRAALLLMPRGVKHAGFERTSRYTSPCGWRYSGGGLRSTARHCPSINRAIRPRPCGTQ